MRIVAIYGLLATGILGAQWLHEPTRGLPRSPDGKPDLAAPTPRAPDGKPDLTGLWKKNPGKYSNDITADLKPSDIQPWAAELSRRRMDNLGKDSPSLNCLPWGPRFSTSFDAQIVQTPSRIVILQDDLSYRQILLDGRKLPQDPNPTWMGYSVGRWEGDTLVVESAGYNDRSWLDGNGHPHTEALHLTEDFHRRDVGHMDVEITIDDPKTYNRSWTVSIPMELIPDTEILEYVCAENERDRSHMVGKASDPAAVAKLTSELLDAYTGVYEMREGGRLTQVTITRKGSDLFLEAEGGGRRTLEPLATDAFADAPDGRLEFVRDAGGVVTGFTVESLGRKMSAIRRP